MAVSNLINPPLNVFYDTSHCCITLSLILYDLSKLNVVGTITLFTGTQVVTILHNTHYPLFYLMKSNHNFNQVKVIFNFSVSKGNRAENKSLFHQIYTKIVQVYAFHFSATITISCAAMRVSVPIILNLNSEYNFVNHKTISI